MCAISQKITSAVEVNLEKIVKSILFNIKFQKLCSFDKLFVKSYKHTTASK